MLKVEFVITTVLKLEAIATAPSAQTKISSDAAFFIYCPSPTLGSRAKFNCYLFCS